METTILNFFTIQLWHGSLQAHFKMNNVTFTPIAPSTITLIKLVETTKVEKTTNNIFGIVAIDIGM